jgi:integrase
MSAAGRATVSGLPEVKVYRKISIQKAIADWTESGKCPRSFLRVTPSVLKLVGEIRLGNISAEFVYGYISKVRNTNSQFNRPFTDATIRKHLSVLRGAVRYVAKKHRVVPDLSVFSTDEIEGEWNVERKRVLSTDEEEKIRAIIPTRTYKRQWAMLLDLAIETGARQAEMVLMEISEVNFQTRVWDIPKEHTKSGYERGVALSEKATKIVTELRDMLVIRQNKESKRGLAPQPEQRLFHVFSTPGSVSSGFAKLAKAACVHDFHFHDLRHTAITRMVMNKRDMNVHEIMRMVGHKSMNMFIRYSNYRPEDLVKRLM